MKVVFSYLETHELWQHFVLVCDFSFFIGQFYPILHLRPKLFVNSSTLSGRNWQNRVVLSRKLHRFVDSLVLKNPILMFLLRLLNSLPTQSPESVLLSSDLNSSVVSKPISLPLLKLWVEYNFL